MLDGHINHVCMRMQIMAIFRRIQWANQMILNLWFSNTDVKWDLKRYDMIKDVLCRWPPDVHQEVFIFIVTIVSISGFVKEIAQPNKIIIE